MTTGRPAEVHGTAVGMRVARLVTALGWWALLAAVLWACFLRPPPRSLAGTLAWLLTEPLPLAIAGCLLVAGALATLAYVRRDALALASLATAALWALAAGVTAAGA